MLLVVAKIRVSAPIRVRGGGGGAVRMGYMESGLMRGPGYLGGGGVVGQM